MKIQVVERLPEVVSVEGLNSRKFYGAVVRFPDREDIDRTRTFITACVPDKTILQYRCYTMYAFTDGNYFFDYANPSLAGLIIDILRRDGEVYQFDTLMELMAWVSGSGV